MWSTALLWSVIIGKVSHIGNLHNWLVFAHTSLKCDYLQLGHILWGRCQKYFWYSEQILDLVFTMWSTALLWIVIIGNVSHIGNLHNWLVFSHTSLKCDYSQLGHILWGKMSKLFLIFWTNFRFSFHNVEHSALMKCNYRPS